MHHAPSITRARVVRDRRPRICQGPPPHVRVTPRSKASTRVTASESEGGCSRDGARRRRAFSSEAWKFCILTETLAILHERHRPQRRSCGHGRARNSPIASERVPVLAIICHTMWHRG